MADCALLSPEAGRSSGMAGSPVKPPQIQGIDINGTDIAFIDEDVDVVPRMVVTSATPLQSSTESTPPTPADKDLISTSAPLPVHHLAVHQKRKPRKQRRRTVSGVTAEASRVFDQFLRRSLSQNDASPLQSHYQMVLDMEVIEEHGDEDSVDGLAFDGVAKSQSCNGIQMRSHENDSLLKTDDHERKHDQKDRQSSYKRNMSYNLSLESMLDGDEVAPEEESHSPVSIRHSVSSGSRGSSLNKRIVHPLPDEKAIEAAMKGKTKKKKQLKKKKQRRLSTSSSSSAESDMGSTQRRKKSLFKRAKERIQESFRKMKDKPSKQSSSDQAKFTGRFSFKRGGSDKSKSSSQTSTTATPVDVVGEKHIHTKTHIRQEVRYSDEYKGGLLLRTESMSQTEQETRDKTTPVSHKQFTVRKKESYPIDGDKTKRNEGIFEGLLRQIRGSSKKLKKPSRDGSLKHQRSNSDAGSCSVDLRAEDVEIGEDRRTKSTTFRQVISGGDQGPEPADVHCSLMPRRNQSGGDGKPSANDRSHMRLDGLVPCLPDRTSKTQSTFDIDVECNHVAQIVRTRDGERTIVTSHTHQVVPHTDEEVEEVEGLDEPDGAVGGKPIPEDPSPVDPSYRPFHERSAKEKEEMYEKVAEQLAAIADNYNASSPQAGGYQSPMERLLPSILTGGGGKPDPNLEQSIGCILRERGDAAAETLNVDMGPVVRELIQNVSYNQFQRAVHTTIGSDPGWQQLAMVFRLARSAIGAAGYGTAVAQQVKEMTLRYFADKFAGWVVNQGGWESVVEETDISGNSEVD